MNLHCSFGLIIEKARAGADLYENLKQYFRAHLRGLQDVGTHDRPFYSSSVFSAHAPLFVAKRILAGRRSAPAVLCGWVVSIHDGAYKAD